MTVIIDGTAGVTFPAGGVGNTASAVVGLTDTQTLTNKTLTSPTISGAVVSSMASSVITSGTSVASTSGTSIDFTSIPSWVKRITVNFQGVSINGSVGMRIQIGTASGIESTGYSGQELYTGTGTGTSAVTTGFSGSSGGGTSVVRNGSCVITLLNSSAYLWVATGISLQADGYNRIFGASKTLIGTLDRVRINANNGTDAFTAGSINILYE